MMRGQTLLRSQLGHGLCTSSERTENGDQGSWVQPAQKGVVVEGRRGRDNDAPTGEGSRQVASSDSTRFWLSQPATTPSEINQQKNHPANLLLNQNLTNTPNIRCNQVVVIFSRFFVFGKCACCFSHLHLNYPIRDLHLPSPPILLCFVDAPFTSHHQKLTV